MTTDFLGREIRAGNLIVYAVRRGSSMWFNKLSVTQVRDDSIAGYNSTGKLLTIKNLQNVVIIGSQPSE